MLLAPTSRRHLKPTALTQAVLWTLLALFCFSAIAIAGREGGRSLSTSELIFWRSLLGILVLAGVYRWQGAGLADLRTPLLPLHAARAVIHYGAQFAWLVALTLIPLANVFALEFTAPLWVAVLAPMFLGERLTRWRIGTALLGFVGALLVVEPNLLRGHLQLSPTAGSLYAVVAAVGFASAMICTKRLTRTDPVVRMLFWMQVFQAMIAAAILGAGAVQTGHWPPSWSSAVAAPVWGWVALLGLAGLAAHYCQMRAFALADAIIVAPMDFLRLPLITVVGALFYGEVMSPTVALGAAVVLVANGTNMWAERRGVARRQP